MSIDDKKSEKKPKRVIVKSPQGTAKVVAEGFNELLGEKIEGRIGDSVHIYGPIKEHGNKNERIISQLTSEFERLLATASEETLKKAFTYLNALQEEKPARQSRRPTKLVVLRHLTGGKLVVEENLRVSPKARARTIIGGGTGSTGPGKPKAKK